MAIKHVNRIIIGIVLGIMLMSLLASAEVPEMKTDTSEGGHLETDFGTGFMAEWWYLNGKATLVASDGEEKDVGLFAVLGHQESPMFNGSSHMLTFYGIYFDDHKNDFNYEETFVSRENVSNYIALHTPYVDYRYPDGFKKLSGSESAGYSLNYTTDNNVTMDIFFQPDVDKTIDQAASPLNFTTYEHSHGKLKGSIILNGKNYKVTRAEGYMDHMIPVGNLPWPMYMHGWNWFEVNTKDYQAVAYAVRGLNDGYSKYSYKHLTLLDKESGRMISEYSGDEITITETGWINEIKFGRKRPSRIVFSTRDLRVSIKAENILYFDRSDPDPTSVSGFVDFMAYQPEDATIKYKGRTDEGNAFFEYLVSDIGVAK
jgi:hypothetical protein